VGGYLDRRLPEETFKNFADRHSDEELIALASNRSVEEVASELAAKGRRAVPEPV
jgi:hypothetical protein